MIKTPSSIVLGGAGIFKKGMTQLGGTINLNLLIKQLFANSEQGFTQTLDDYSILFQDAAGTTSVIGAGQTLGLVLDKSKGLVLGNELNSNNFNTDLTGWGVGSATNAVIENGEVKVTFGGDLTASSNNWFKFNGTYVLGKRYIVSFDATYVSGGSLQAGVGYSVGLTVTAASNGGTKKNYTFTCSGLASGGGALIEFGSSASGSVWKIDNVSVKEVLGNHTYQTTSSYRPLLQNTPRRIQYDGFDDKLTTTLPAQLTGCTVIRAIPNVGCQILTNQTIPTPYNDSTSHCGLIVINRALTAYETSLVTQIFNKLAGV